MEASISSQTSVNDCSEKTARFSLISTDMRSTHLPGVENNINYSHLVISVLVYRTARPVRQRRGLQGLNTVVDKKSL